MRNASLLAALCTVLTACDASNTTSRDSTDVEDVDQPPAGDAGPACADVSAEFDEVVRDTAAQYLRCDGDSDCVIEEAAYDCGDGTVLERCGVALEAEHREDFSEDIGHEAVSLCGRAPSRCAPQVDACDLSWVARCVSGVCEAVEAAR